MIKLTGSQSKFLDTPPPPPIFFVHLLHPSVIISSFSFRIWVFLLWCFPPQTRKLTKVERQRFSEEVEMLKGPSTPTSCASTTPGSPRWRDTSVSCWPPNSWPPAHSKRELEPHRIIKSTWVIPRVVTNLCDFLSGPS